MVRPELMDGATVAASGRPDPATRDHLLLPADSLHQRDEELLVSLVLDEEFDADDVTHR
ncbi:hypothetical protein [Candidatus Palauibacter sp.]|uniref:hypothetical protein n=1 Tax=Candidatus Palauibacter sp. TaxID=3101350 RepID=UPI003B0131B8